MRKAAGTAIRRLLVENASRAPAEWYGPGGLPRNLVSQQACWACMAELVAAGMLDRNPASCVAVGRNGVSLDVSFEIWSALGEDLGWEDGRNRGLALEVLTAHLVPLSTGQGKRDPGGGKLAELLPQRLLALVLLTVLLERLDRDGASRVFAYEFRELTKVAQSDLGWAAVGNIDEPELARKLFGYAGSDMRRSDLLLQTPFHAYWRPIARSIQSLRGKRQTGSPLRTSAPLSPDFLLSGLRNSLDAGPEGGGVVPEIPREARRLHGVGDSLAAELNRLRGENDSLRSASVARWIPTLLQPLLTLSGDPVSALEKAAGDSAGLARDLALAFRTLILGGEIELFAEPGQVVRLLLPNPSYRIEGAGPGPRGGSAPVFFRVGRRGIRIAGNVITPALVTPTKRGPADE